MAQPDKRPAGLRGKLGAGGAKRAYWAIASQALDSAANFFLNVWVARSVGVHEAGAFGAVYVAYVIAGLLSRSTANMPMMIVFSASEKRFSREVAGDTLGASLAAGLAFSVGMAIFGVFAHGPIKSVALAMALVLCGLMLQDCCVYLFIARQRPQLAVVNNGLWLAFQVVFFLTATYGFDVHKSWVFVILWGVAAILAVLVSLFQMKAWPALRRAPAWYRRHRSAIVDLSVESAITQGGQQGVVYVIGFGVSIVGIAAFRAAQVPLGLLRVFFNGLIPIGVSEGARLYARRPALLVLMIRLWALGGAVLNVAFGLVLIFMPRSIGRSFLGESWNYAHPILIWITIATAANAVIIPVQAGLRSLAATRTAVKLRVPIVVSQLVAALAGVVVDGLRGGCIGYMAGSVLGAVLAMITFHRTIHRLGGRPVGEAAAGSGAEKSSGRHRAAAAETALEL